MDERHLLEVGEDAVEEREQQRHGERAAAPHASRGARSVPDRDAPREMDDVDEAADAAGPRSASPASDGEAADAAPAAQQRAGRRRGRRGRRGGRGRAGGNANGAAAPTDTSPVDRADRADQSESPDDEFVGDAMADADLAADDVDVPPHAADARNEATESFDSDLEPATDDDVADEPGSADESRSADERPTTTGDADSSRESDDQPPRRRRRRRGGRRRRKGRADSNAAENVQSPAGRRDAEGNGEPGQGRAGETAEDVDLPSDADDDDIDDRNARGGGKPSSLPASLAAPVRIPEPPVVRTGSTDRHLVNDEPVRPEPARRPRTYRDLDEIPEDFD
jgi:ribonuclease E